MGAQTSEKTGGRVLLPAGEGGRAKREPDRAEPEERGPIRANIDAFPHPRPALRAVPLPKGEGHTHI